MQKFFICTTGIAKGPYVLNDLLKNEIDEKDLIWCSDWRRTKYAYQIRELRGYFGDKWAIQHPARIRRKILSHKKLILVFLVTALAALIFYYFFQVNV